MKKKILLIIKKTIQKKIVSKFKKSNYNYQFKIITFFIGAKNEKNKSK